MNLKQILIEIICGIISVEKQNKYYRNKWTQNDHEKKKRTAAEYVLIGGQLLDPQTKAKWIKGSCVSRATFRRGSDEPKGFINIPGMNYNMLQLSETWN